MNLDYFRKHIKTQLKSQGIALSMLAKEADLSEDTLRSLIYGKSQDARISTISKIADVLGCSVDSLLGREHGSDILYITEKLVRLSPRSLRTIRTIVEIEERSTQSPSDSGKLTIPVLVSVSGFQDGIFYDAQNSIPHDISSYPESLKKIIDFGVLISSDYYEPVYYANDILLLTTQKKPAYDDIVVYLNEDGRLYIRRYTRTGLEPVGAFGEKIAGRDEHRYRPVGVVVKAAKEFNIEQYR